MTLVRTDGEAFDLGAARRLHDAVLAVWHDKAENDGFNALVLLAGLAWRRAALLRTIARYLRQTEHSLFARLFLGRASPQSGASRRCSPSSSPRASSRD